MITEGGGMKALTLLLLSGVLTAGVFIAGKQAGNDAVSPLLILLWQISGGALVVWIIAWPSRTFPIWNTEHIRYYLIGGLLGISLPYVLAFIVMRELQVGTVGLMTALSPVMTYAMARLLGHEGKSMLRLLGLVAGLGGVMLLVKPGYSVAILEGDLSRQGLFMLLALAIPLSLAAGNIYRSRYWPAQSEAMPLVIGMLTVQGVSLLIINLVIGNLQHAQTSVQYNGWLMLVLALLAGASYLSAFKLLRVGGPVYLSQMGYVITAVTVLFGIYIWDEHYDRNDIVSMVLILSGVLLTTWAGRKRSMGAVR